MLGLILGIDCFYFMELIGLDSSLLMERGFELILELNVEGGFYFLGFVSFLIILLLQMVY